jgi:hypothetical protein
MSKMQTQMNDLIEWQLSVVLLLSDGKVIGVADGASGGQPACPGKWKMYRKKK